MKIFNRGFIAFIITITTIGCTSTSSLKDTNKSIEENDSLIQQSSNIESMHYIFRIGDQLRITIRGYSEFDTTVFVTETGTISMRLIGELKAANISRTKLMDDIISKLKVFVKADVHPTVIVLNALIQRVSVLGAVVKQDNYSISHDVTLLQILTLAGGTTPESDLQHIKIFRNGEKGNFEEIDFSKYIANNNIKEMPTVKPGDIVYVPREENIIRELSSFFRDTIFLFTLFTISK